MFKVGQYVIYKKDLCRIKNIKEIKNRDYYVLAPIEDESLIIDVLIENKDNYLREVVTKDEANEIISSIPNINPIDCDDRLVENEYKRLLNSNSHEGLIQIIKTTYLRNKKREDNQKKLGDKDSYYFQKAETYFYNEMAIALGMSVKEVREYITKRIETK